MSKSLAGRVVIVTRPLEDAEELARPLESRGATALLAPAIERSGMGTRQLDGAVKRMAAGEFEWVVFTSRAGVDAIVGRLPALGLSAQAVNAKVAAVGEGTARALRERGVEPALVPGTFTTEALARAMPHGSGTALLARADVAPDGLEEALARKGWTPVRVDAYRTRPAKSLPRAADRALRQGRVDAVTFTSASTVQGFVGVAAEALEATARRPKIVCIGPVTARAARASGLRVDAVARPHTIEGVVAALERVLGDRSLTAGVARKGRS